MTIEEAENYYFYEVEEAKKREIARAKKTLKKVLIIGNVIIFILLLIGIILTVVGFTTPPEETLVGLEMDSADALLEKLFGSMALSVGVILILGIDVWLNIAARKTIKKGQINLLPYIKNLYQNYLRCEDMKPEEKEYYKQKLEDMRIEALTNAARSAASTASAAILFSTLYK